MISRELRYLSRKELVDIIYQLKKNEQERKEEVDALERALQEKRIRVSVAGSIAEAATDITQIFATAQRTADLYLHEIAFMKENTEKECAAKIEEATLKVAEIMEDGKKQLADLNARYKADYQKWQQLKEEIQQLEEMKAKE